MEGMTRTSSKPDTERYLEETHRSKVAGEAFFALLDQIEREAGAAAKWRRLERLERHMKDRLQEELVRRGRASAEDPDHRAASADEKAAVEQGRQRAIAFSSRSGADPERAFGEALRQLGEELRAALEDAPEDLPEIRSFVERYRETLGALARGEAADDGESARRTVEAFLASTGAHAEAPLPTGVRLTPLDDVFREDPNPTLHRLRRRAPVLRDRDFRRVVLTRHDDVERVLRDPSFWVDGRKSSEEIYRRSYEERESDPSMLGLDDPEHKRLRNLVSRSFTPRKMEVWRPMIREIAGELLDAVDRAGETEFDLVHAFAAPLPAIAIARLLGVDPAKQADFKVWSEASVEADFNRFASEELKAFAVEARAELDACFREEIRKRKQHPADDLIGKMVSAEEEGDHLSEQEIVTMCDLLLVAGNVTTSDLIGTGMRALLETPGQLELLRRRPELLENAVEEMLRCDPPISMSVRLAPRDLTIGGVPVRRGESIMSSLGAANRDPEVYPDPDRFDIAREDTHHQAFGGGVHLCLGAHLARIEAQEAVAALVARYPKLRPGKGGYSYKRVPGFRGLAEYWVRRD